MEVKRVRTAGWTKPALTARFWAAMEDEQKQRMAAKLVAERDQRDWSAERLAQEAGVSSKTISRWENCRTDEPRTDHVQKVAAALGINPEDLTGPRLVAADGEPGPIERLEEKLEELAEALAELLAIASERVAEDAGAQDDQSGHEDEGGDDESGEKPG